MLTRQNFGIFETVEANAAFQEVLKILDLVHVAHVRVSTKEKITW